MSEDVRAVRFRGVECRLTRAGRVVRIEVAGEVDISVAGELGAWLLSSAGTHEQLALDLTKITFMDSTGLHMLIRLRRDLPQRFHLEAVSPHVHGLLGVTGLTKFFD
jgi:anti-sigma B factor antagonist